MSRRAAQPTASEYRRMGAAAAAVGLALLVLALPRINGYLGVVGWSMMAPDALDLGGRIDTPQLAAAKDDFCSSSVKVPTDAVIAQSCARLAMRLAGAAPDAAASLALLEEAESALRRSLADAPDRALAWSLLAAVAADMKEPPEKIIDALRMAYLTGPREGASMIVRSEVVLRQWDGMPGDLRDGCTNDLSALWRSRPLRDELVRIYLSSDFDKRSIIRRAALATPQDEWQFDKLARKAAGLSLPNATRKK